METIFTLSNILYFSTTLQMLKNLGAEMDALVDFPPIDLVRATYPPTINPVTYCDTYEHKVTPLIFMLSQRHYEAVERLLKMGASPSQPDCQGVTPLMYAARLVSWSETYFPKYFETQYGYSNLIDSLWFAVTQISGHQIAANFWHMYATTAYRKISNIRRTKSPNLNVPRLVLQSSLTNPMKPGVKSRMKM